MMRPFFQFLSTWAPGQAEVTGTLPFEPQPGERWALLGRNASGKTTLLQRMARALRQQAAYMPQHHSDAFALPVWQWLDLHAKPLNRRVKCIGAAVGVAGGAAGGAVCGAKGNEGIGTMAREALCKRLQIWHLRHRPITQLSGGERQRVGLAAVAVQNKTIWLLDEPISAQDPAHQRMIGTWLQGYSAIEKKEPRKNEAEQAQCGGPPRSAVFAVHDVQWAKQVATHVYALLPGGGVLLGLAADVLTPDNIDRIFEL